MEFVEGDVTEAVGFLMNIVEPTILKTSNAFLKELDKITGNNNMVRCTFGMKNIPKSIAHLVMDSVSFMLSKRKHTLFYSIVWKQVSKDTAQDKELKSTSTRRFDADITATIVPDGYANVVTEPTKLTAVSE